MKTQERLPIDALSLEKVNELLKDDPNNLEALKRRSNLLKVCRQNRVTQVSAKSKSVIEKIKTKLSGGK